MDDVLAMKNMLHFHEVKLDLYYETQSSDQDICRIIEQAEGLALVALNVKATAFIGTGLSRLLTTSGSILKELDLADTNISDAALAGVQLPRLEMLRLYFCRKLTDTGVHELLTTSGSILKDLDLADTIISDAALAGVQLPKLEMLNLGSCSNLTRTGVNELLTTSGSILKELDLTDTIISVAALVGVQLPKLEVLYLGGYSNLTDTGVQELLSKTGGHLTKLDLERTDVSGGMLVGWLEGHAPSKLKTLSLEDCPNVSSADADRIRSLLPNCYVVHS